MASRIKRITFTFELKTMTDKIKHLDYIQQTITRMATISFQIKAWNIGLVTAVLAFAAGDKNSAFLWVALLPAMMLWFLDSYYRRQERLFRALYDAVRAADSTVGDFSMDTRPYATAPNMQRWRVMFSETLLPFHGTVLAVVVLAMCLLR
jgi:hypothetical protein